MATNTPISMAEELLNSLYTKPYTGMLPYLSPATALSVSDFEKSSLSKDHWLDFPTLENHHKGCKKCDPSHVFDVFGFLSDHEALEVRQEMLSSISNEFNYFHDVSWLSLQMNKTTLSAWCSRMQNPTTPADELAIFALTRLYRHHAVVYTKSKTWSTIGTSTPMSEKEVYLQCEIKFVLMGNHNFIQLIKKPSVAMPIVQFDRMESVYESGYFVNAEQDNQKSDHQTAPNFPTTTEQLVEPVIEDQHVVAARINMTDGNLELPKLPAPVEIDTSINNPVSFPVAAKVCKTSKESNLIDFNPLNDSEPNLEFDMTSRNNELDLHVKLMHDAKTQKWEVKIRNLTKEQIDFISGPKLLPTLGKADAVMIEHGPVNTDNTVPVESVTAGTNANDIEIAKNTEPSIDVDNDKNSGITQHQSNGLQAVSVTNNSTTMPISVSPKKKRAHQTTTKNINYSTMAMPDEVSDSDSDEYKPVPVPAPKLNNKHYPSATRITAQRPKRKSRTVEHEEPEHSKSTNSLQTTVTPDADNTSDNKKGKLNIKTVALPKRVCARTFKCQICKLVCHNKKQ